MKKLAGNTYEHKDKIREAGGKWDAQEKAWYVPEEKFDELQRLCSFDGYRCRDCLATFSTGTMCSDTGEFHGNRQKERKM